jgi:predicted membrane-bound spermidine synthase
MKENEKNNPIKTILLVVTLSGVCGIAYETLYSLMLSTYFGNIFYIQAAILITFLFSIGVGSLIAYKFIKYIWLIELGIGIYALLTVFLFNQEDLIINFIASLNYQIPIILTLTVASFLIVPAALIGFSIPIMTIYLRESLKSNKDKSFNYVYLVYNLGASVCILLVEFLLLRKFGITLAVIFIASVNFIISFLLFKKIKIPKIKIQDKIYLKDLKNWYKSNKLIVLFLISLASGMFQLIFLKIINIIFGPLNENFSIMLAVVFLGMAGGSFIAYKFKLKFSVYLILFSLVIVASFVFINPIIYLWAFFQENFAIERGVSLPVKLLIVAGFGLLGFTMTGLSIPLLYQKVKNKFKPGELLAISSFGNCFGFLLVTFFLFEHLNMFLLPIVTGGLVFFTIFIYSKNNFKKVNFFYLVVFLILSFLIYFFWPTELLKVGYRRFNSIQEISYFRENFKKVNTYKKFDNDVSVIELKNGSRWLTLNGYLTLAFSRNNDRTTLRETILGISPALFSEKQQNALIIGLGSGVTAGAAGEVFSKVRVVDINPAMIEIMEEFKENNYDILGQNNVDIVIQDGIIELFQTKEKYDAIVNTLTTPTYYSASKFWTKNVYDQISKKLNPDGVYAGWFDTSIGKKGIQIMAKTLKASFEDCRFIVLNSTYYGTICKNKPIKMDDLNKINWSEKIINKYEEFYFSKSYDLNDFLIYLIVEIDDRKISDKKIALNTFNRQVLGFQEVFYRSNLKLKEFLRSILEDNLDKDYDKKCQAYRNISGSDVCRAYNLL